FAGRRRRLGLRPAPLTAAALCGDAQGKHDNDRCDAEQRHGALFMARRLQPSDRRQSDAAHGAYVNTAAVACQERCRDLIDTGYAEEHDDAPECDCALHHLVRKVRLQPDRPEVRPKADTTSEGKRARSPTMRAQLIVIASLLLAALILSG